MNRFVALCIAFLIMLTATAFAEQRSFAEQQSSSKPARSTLDPNLPYQGEKANPVAYDVDFSVVVTPPCHAKVLKVWLPLPQSDAGQEVVETELGSFPMKIEPKIASEGTYGNKFAYFEFQHPEGAQIIRHKFKITVWELRWNVKPDQVEQVDHWPDNFKPYLRSDQSVLVDDRFRKIAKEIVSDRHGQGHDLGSVMEWLNGYMKYDHSVASLRASSEHALTNHAGHCSDYHGLCAAVSRALGYPSRITYGINAFPKNSPSHCKMEAFIPPYGWVSFDVAETQNLIGLIKKSPDLDDKKKQALVRAATERLLSGFRDNTWFLQTRGTDYDLAPPAAKRVPVVRTIYAEADGIALPDPDPADPHKHEFAWMTIHEYRADKKVPYPFKDWSTLKAKPGD